MFPRALVFLACAAAGLAQSRIRFPIGITRLSTPVEGMITSDDLDYRTPKTRILLVGGIDGSRTAGEMIRAALEWFDTSPAASRYRGQFDLSAVPLANPDKNTWRSFPPAGEAYGGVPDPEAHYLWRWIGMHAPDLVVELDSGELVSGLAQATPANTASIPARRLAAKPGFLPALLGDLEREKFSGPSPARREIQRRLARTPRQVAEQLALHYGHDLTEAVYIPAFALIGRLRLGAVEDVERIVKPYFEGAKASLGSTATGSHLAGHLVFAELATLTGKPRYVELVRSAAGLGFDQQGKPRDSMPLHNEMSDAVFMGCPILAQAGRLTSEPKYFDMSLRHMRFMLGLNLRPDGLHRHSPLDSTAWGRGNAFAALGLALALSEMPRSQPGRQEMLRAFQAHIEALARHQDVTGMWHQVIDVPASYRELTATAMIAVAILRGIRNGWLEAGKHQPMVDKAWRAVNARVGPGGGLVDVCTSTGKQKSLREYLDRTAILGPDPRGGAMALLLATEMER
ncbi:MAG: glycoside hydrolase family 88 protein [Candidatus Solibacter usitatus]|nr:glycoside hydrolase family 88 protein [Candidatus Solibacter usitatus]